MALKIYIPIPTSGSFYGLSLWPFQLYFDKSQFPLLDPFLDCPCDLSIVFWRTWFHRIHNGSDNFSGFFIFSLCVKSDTLLIRTSSPQYPSFIQDWFPRHPLFWVFCLKIQSFCLLLHLRKKQWKVLYLKQ